MHVKEHPSKVCIRSSGATPFEFMCILRDWLHCVQQITTSSLTLLEIEDDNEEYSNDDDDDVDERNLKIPIVPAMSEQALQTFREWITGVMMDYVAFKVFNSEYRSKSPAEFGFTMFCRHSTELFRNIKRNGSTEGGYSMRNMTDPFLVFIRESEVGI